MKEVADLLNAMRQAGVIRAYAIFGAVAQMRYTEPVMTLDVDVLVLLPTAATGLDLLAPIYDFCAAAGYRPEGEAIRVAAWPVQFVPTFSDLTAEAVDDAEEVDFEGASLRVVRPAYLAAIALSVGRAKDFARVLALLEAPGVAAHDIEEVAGRHGLLPSWQRFRQRFDV